MKKYVIERTFKDVVEVEAENEEEAFEEALQMDINNCNIETHDWEIIEEDECEDDEDGED